MNIIFSFICLFPVLMAIFCFQCEKFNPEYVSNLDSIPTVDTSSGEIITKFKFNNKSNPYCYPNPAYTGDTAFIVVTLYYATEVTVNIIILDPMEIPVKTLSQVIWNAGNNIFPWDLSNVDAGLYTAKISINSESGKFQKYVKIAVRNQ